MTPYHGDRWLELYQGEASEVLAGLPSASVHAAITSPPYWGLRDYGTGEWSGGDDPACDHRPKVQPRSERPMGAIHGGFASIDAADSGAKAYRDLCRRCGARRQDRQLGLERSPEEYVERLVAILRELRRVLRPDGLLWLNLGDSYAGNGGTVTTGRGQLPADAIGYAKWNRAWGALKPKDLVGIPWRVALALQADGWYLRRDVVWHKPNAMPESVTDRPTSAHEYVFMLARSERYFYDAEAVREGNANPELARSEHLRRDWRDRPGNGEWPSGTGGRMGSVSSGRNLRSVWTIATAPYPGAHFAAFPPALVRPMIAASTSERGVCPECGAPWARVTDADTSGRPQKGGTKFAEPLRMRAARRFVGGDEWREYAARPRVYGWRPTCRHYPRVDEWRELPPRGPGESADEYEARTLGERGLRLALLEEWEPLAAVPATVLDPFAGTGTVGMVAQQLGRRAVLGDLNGEYLRLALERASREWGVGGPILEDDGGAELPDDSLWAAIR